MEYTIKKNTIPLNEDYDVIVCGGGPAGVTAAISAAREGAKTLLLEASGVLGGMSTNGLVNAWTPMSDGIRWIHGGLTEKIIRKGAEHMKHVDAETIRVIPIDFERLKQIYDQMVVESGADLLFHTSVYGVEMKDDRNIDVIIVGNKSGLTAYRAKVYIDCTGDADLYAWAGKEYQKGNEETGEYMAASLCFTVTNIDEYEFPFMERQYGGKYNIDVHTRKKGGVSKADAAYIAKNQNGGDIVQRYGRYGEGESYGVPYRCMCPRDLDNVLVAGRTVSSERVANGTLRVMPCCMCEGEAVGMAAKLACEMDHPNIHKVDTQRLRKRLIEEGAYLPKLDTDTF